MLPFEMLGITEQHHYRRELFTLNYISMCILAVKQGNWIYWTLTERNYKWQWQSVWVMHSKDHCKHSTHKVFSLCYVFTSCCLVTDSKKCPLQCSCSCQLVTVSQLTHCFNCRLTKLKLWPVVSQLVCLVVKHHLVPKPDFCYCQTFAGLLMWSVLSDGGMGLYNCCWPLWAQLCLGPSPARLMIIFSRLRFETPPTWRPRSLYLYSPGTGYPVMPPGTRVPFYCLLWLVGLWWRYLNPCSLSTNWPACNILARTTQKALFLCCCGSTLACKAVTY
jgi:hypothetical protein